MNTKLMYFQIMSSDDELADILYCHRPAKKLWTDEKEAFLDLQEIPSAFGYPGQSVQ